MIDEMTEQATETESLTQDQAMENTIRAEFQRLTGNGDSLHAGDDPATEPAGRAGADAAKNATTEAVTAGGRARGPDGKFVSGATAPARVDTPPAGQTAGVVEPKPFDTYPASWKKDHEAKWATLDPALREEIHRREQNFLDGIKDYKQPAAFGRAIGEHLLPHVETFRRLNTTPVDVVRDLVGTWSQLVNGDAATKQRIYLQIARDFGIEVPSRGSSPLPQGGNAQPVPGVDLGPVTQRLSATEQELKALKAEAQRLDYQRADEQLDAFGKSPGHEFYTDATVRQTMGQLLTSGLATSLQDAYDKAVWQLPEVRAKLQAAEAEKQRAKDAEQAAAARKAAAANVRPRGTPPVARKPGSMEDTIREKGRELGMF